uniref:Uncharacterized protein n=1 Tax=Meloidogyne enterolobii TaxID=390850 RepID=A0A6V7XZL0_MELEN|nr:unnamed protein product [Meloidogyne enterolobii]
MEIKKDFKSRSYEIKEKDKLILLIGVKYLIKLELKHPEILKIELLQRDVGIYYYKSYLESPEFPHTTESETKLHTIFLLNEIYDKFRIIIKKFEKNNNYLIKIFNDKLEDVINQIFSNLEESSNSEVYLLCYMSEFREILQLSFDVSFLL